MLPLVVIIVISVVVLVAIRASLLSAQRDLIGRREFAAVIVLPTIATFSPNYLILSLLIVLTMAFSPAKPEQRIRLFFFCTPLLPPLSLIVMAPAPINQLVRFDYNILLALGCLGAAIIVSNRGTHVIKRWDAAMLLMAAVMLFIDVRGSSASNTLRAIVQQGLTIGVPYFVVSRGTALVRKPVDLLLCIVFAATIVAAITAFESARHWLLYTQIEAGLGLDPDISAYAKQRGGFLRGRATFSESTSLSLFIGLATIILFSLRQRFKRKTPFLLIMTTLTIGQIFSFARIGLVMTAVGLLACLWFERRNALFVSILVASPILWAGSAVLGRFVPAIGAALGQSEDAAGSIDYRSRLAKRIIEEIRERPLLGISQDEIQFKLDDMRQGEGIIDLVNTHLVIALQSGILGLLLFLVPSVMSLVTLAGLRRTVDQDNRLVASACFAALVALHVGLYTTTYLGRNLLWVVMIIGATAGLALRLAVVGKNSPLVVPNSLRAKSQSSAVRAVSLTKGAKWREKF